MLMWGCDILPQAVRQKVTWGTPVVRSAILLLLIYREDYAPMLIVTSTALIDYFEFFFSKLSFINIVKKI
jgi:hypothetical protein